QNWLMNKNMLDEFKIDIINKITNQFGIYFNGCVYNVYTSKYSHIWWHTDGQPGISDIVATFTTGRSANLEFRKLKINHDNYTTDKNNKNDNNKNDNDNNKNDNNNNNNVKYNRNNDDFPSILSVPCHHGTLCIMGPQI